MRDALDEAKERLRRGLERREVRVGFLGGIAGFIVGELASGRVREDLGFKGTRESAMLEKFSERMARVADKNSLGLASGLAFLAGEPELAFAGLGMTAGLAAAEVHKDAGPLHLPKLAGKMPNTGELLNRAWKAQRIEINDLMPSEQKFKLLGDLINQLVVEGSRDPEVRAAAEEACANVDSSIQSYAEAVGSWVRDRVAYRFDEDMTMYTDGGEVKPEPNGSLEIFQEAAQTLKSGFADCDCYTILLLSMLRSQGIYGYARMVSQDPLRPDDYTHIYPVVPLEDGTEFCVDLTPVQTLAGFVYKPVGWECDRASSLTVLMQPLAESGRIAAAA